MRRNWWKLFLVAVLVAAVAIALAGKNRSQESSGVATRTEKASQVQTEVTDQASEAAGTEHPIESAVTVKQADQKRSEAERPSTEPEPAKTAKPTPMPEAPKKAALSPGKGKPETVAPESSKPAQPEPRRLPRMLELGADKCVPCKMMKPIIDELQREYKGKLEFEFIDVWKNPGTAEKFGIQAIPTQIFYDADGKEFFRHTGFFSKEDILATFRDHGIQL